MPTNTDLHKVKVQPLSTGNQVYLATANLSMLKGRARKLIPQYIDPYQILEGNSSNSTYLLDLLEDLRKCRIHPHFHANLLRHHKANNTALFPHQDTAVIYDLGKPDEQEWYVDEIVTHLWEGRKI
ncbi:hypothetical protein PHLCEN_2v4446 [Hermanssonia centrifuga]|uniref:Tf2-1-like SH3-like domain-containing protein n=1 Tax=Hermanssonia centrifuga TaxID=98765 RepID=A0A2R6PNI1_9APHY|nr:hypothetical protein PHLCEN_2v4446 [Hermanssonia centrifuga]